VAIALAKGAMPTSELEVRHDDEVGKARHKWELRSTVGRNTATYRTSTYIISSRLPSISYLLQYSIPKLVPLPNIMPLTKKVILTDKAPKPLSVLNQGLVVGDMVNSMSLPFIMTRSFTEEWNTGLLLWASWNRSCYR
jgi:hypothetical protein